jgi:hypothetical protein
VVDVQASQSLDQRSSLGFGQLVELLLAAEFSRHGKCRNKREHTELSANHGMPIAISPSKVFAD